jgi:hypothetical protein
MLRNLNLSRHEREPLTASGSSLGRFSTLAPPLTTRAMRTSHAPMPSPAAVGSLSLSLVAALWAAFELALA